CDFISSSVCESCFSNSASIMNRGSAVAELRADKLPGFESRAKNRIRIVIGHQSCQPSATKISRFSSPCTFSVGRRTTLSCDTCSRRKRPSCCDHAVRSTLCCQPNSGSGAARGLRGDVPGGKLSTVQGTQQRCLSP